MISLLLIIKKLWNEDEEFRALLYILVALLITGTVFYSIVENWRIVDSIYFCIMTISTIGYGDYTPTKDISKIFTMVFALAGIGVFVAIATKLAQGLARRRIEKHRGRKETHSTHE